MKGDVHVEVASGSESSPESHILACFSEHLIVTQ